jgi:hypothetical protein
MEGGGRRRGKAMWGMLAGVGEVHRGSGGLRTNASRAFVLLLPGRILAAGLDSLSIHWTEGAH